MSTHNSPTTRRFVRTAWIMLACQFVAAAGAVGAAVWAVGEVRTLVNDRAMLQARVTELEAAQNQAAPAPPPVETPVAPPTNEVIPEPAPLPTPPNATPAPTPVPVTPNRPTRPTRPGQPVYTPPVEEPPVYTPPPYTPPPPTDGKPPVTYDPPPERPRRPRPHIDLPGLIGGIINSVPDRPRRPNYPDRPQRTPGTNDRPPSRTPTNPNNNRPPSTYVPGTTQPPRSTGTANNGQVVRRVPRRPATNTTTTPQDGPVVR